MKIKRTVALLAAISALHGWTASAQVSTQELYNVRFRASCTPSDNPDGRPRKMTERHLISHCVGDGFTAQQLRRLYALVYNPALDRIQVVERDDGSPVCDALIFEGGTNAVGSNQLTRFTFIFRPDQSNAIGSAVITERALDENRRPHLSGRLQFTWTAHTTQTNAETNTFTDVQTEPQTNAPVFTTLHLTNSTPITDTNGSTIPNLPGDPGNNGSNGGTNLVNGNTNTIPTDPDSPSLPGGSLGAGSSTDPGGSPGSNGFLNGSATGEAVGEFVQAAAAASAVAAGEVEICVGTFSLGRQFRPRNAIGNE